jgi:putative MATE family efflux protein
MSRRVNLLDGDIVTSMIKLSLPLMATAFIQIAYSLVDLMWLGKLSTDAVAAVGCIGFFVWIAQALTLIAKTGLSVGMSQAYGKDDRESLISILRSGFQVNFIIYVLITLIFILFKKQLVGFYRLEPSVEILAFQYFDVIIFGLLFLFLAPALSTCFYAVGNSSLPFKIAAIALVTNIVLDPLLIFGVGFFPKLGVRGAAVATVFAQFVQIVIYIFVGIKYKELYVKVNFFEKLDKDFCLDILFLGVPICLTSIVHALVGIKLNSYIAGYGAAAIAAYTIGAQIESVSWLTAEGFATAISTFFGQNYGAKQFDRLSEARNKSLMILTIFGLIVSSLMFIFSREIFEFFIPVDKEVISIGSLYLKINAISELFLAYEIGVTGMLNGLSLTKYPAFNTVIFNILRIPLAIVLMPKFGVNGLWIAMSVSTFIKGVVMLIIYNVLKNKTDGFRINMSRYVSRVKSIV